MIRPSVRAAVALAALVGALLPATTLAGGPQDSNPESLTRVGSKVFFVAFDAVNGTQLRVTDGTTEGTKLVEVIGAGDASVRCMTAWKGSLWFNARDDAHGAELWRSQGTAATTERVADIGLDEIGGDPCGFTAVGDHLYFTAYEEATGYELWRTTSAGVVERVKDIDPGSASSRPRSMQNLKGTLIFFAETASGGLEPYRSNGTEAGTVRIKDIAPGSDSGAQIDPDLERKGAAVAGGRVVFQGYDATAGRELWATDGTRKGTVRLTDTIPGIDGSNPQGFTTLGSKVIFRAYSAAGTEPWVTDGTKGGTIRLKDIEPGSSGSAADQLTRAGSFVYFRATTLASGTDLYRTNGTPAGTKRVKNLPANADFSSLTAVGSTVWFAGDTDAAGLEAWISDGTSAGTKMVVNADSFGDGTRATWPFAAKAGTVVVFPASDGTHGMELWAATPSGTNAAMLANIAGAPDN